MSEVLVMFDCPQCSEETEELHEGYCKECCDENNKALHTHNHHYDRWSRLPEEERVADIVAATLHQL